MSESADTNGWVKRNGGAKVADVVARLITALEPEDVVLGGGNVKRLKELPPRCRAGDNANAFLGGFRLWQQAGDGILGATAEIRSWKTQETKKEYENGNSDTCRHQSQRIQSLNKRKAWKALQVHHANVRDFICEISSRMTQAR